MLGSYFSSGQQGAIAAAAALSISAVYFFQRGAHRAALSLLLASALLLRLFAALLDPFLNTWDEAVHALVAKHLSEDPLKPYLYTEEALALDHTQWTHNHVWLHKQPFFLWCMALSIKAFGPTVLAVRLPSVVFMTALVGFTYGIANAIAGQRAAFVTALLMTWTQWHLRLVAGAVITDHNDAAFIALVGGSIWAWFLGHRARDLRWAVLIGAFSGAALLTKWLPGLLVFLPWGLIAAWRTIRGRGRQEWRSFGASLMVVILMVLPWQLYAWSTYPIEMAHEMAYNTAHVWTPLEGHTGDGWFYWEALREQLFPIAPFVVFSSVAWMVFLHRKDEGAWHMGISVGFVYVFYSLVATKMKSYAMLVVPYLFIGVGGALAWIVDRTLKGLVANTSLILLAVSVAVMLFNVERLQLLHTTQCSQDPYASIYRTANIHNLQAMQSVKDLTAGHDRVFLFNVPFPADLQHSFFHGQEALPWLPYRGQLERLSAKGYSIFIVDPPECYDVPREVGVIDLKGMGFRPTEP
ncbi:MAG: glycosyltransferase family 39 protein [Flavobacteriales bacterium]|nr:glycosyltransferase family 39 protein [Flavobacteriales bacterium]